MSTPKPPPPVLPSAAIDRLFARFVAIYGAQKMAGAWGNVDVAERNATWAAALGRFALDVVRDAVLDLAEKGTGWPPALPEFVDLCERHDQRPGRHLALPVPGRTSEDLELGREQMGAIRSLLAAAVKRPPSGRAAPARVPGSDDEPLPPPSTAACTCWVGLKRSPTLCPTCAGTASALTDAAIRTERARHGA